MYKDFFKLSEMPFSIVPSSRYMFLSERHQEAMYHLQSGLSNGGGFALLTGEVGTGKTTISKVLLSQLGDDIRSGLLLNPTYSPHDLLEAICDEFSISYPAEGTQKQLTQAIYDYLLNNHQNGVLTLLIIDEAQHLSAEVLEQLRLLTNLETDTQKLLKVMLIGQPELQDTLQQPHLRQLAQRITARYHLLPLTADEVASYIDFRLNRAGATEKIFSSKAIAIIAKNTQGIPRLVNLVCDKALHHAYHAKEFVVSTNTAEKACADALYFMSPQNFSQMANSPRGSQSSEIITNIESKSTREHAQNVSEAWRYLFSIFFGAILAVAMWFVFPWSVSLISPQEVENKHNTQALVKPLIEKSNNAIKAMDELLTLWGYQPKAGEGDCRHLSQVNLYCYQGKGSLVDLKILNRPAVLTMKDNYRSYFVVLYKLSEQYAHILIGGKHFRVPTEWLEKHWNGNYQMLWQSPIKNRQLSRYDNDVEVQHLSRHLSKALGEQDSLPYEEGKAMEFDGAIERKLEAFQTWQSLEVNGRLTEMTLMRLDSYTNMQAPTLNYQSNETQSTVEEVMPNQAVGDLKTHAETESETKAKIEMTEDPQARIDEISIDEVEGEFQVIPKDPPNTGDN